MLGKVVAFAAALALIAPAVAVAAVTEAKDLEQRAETPYRVFCIDVASWPRPDAVGLSDWPTGRLWLRGDLCDALRGPLVVTPTYAQAVWTLLHELGEVGWQTPDDHRSECWAAYTIRVYARRDLGATQAQANTLYALGWTQHLNKPPDYQGCAGFPRDPFA